MGSISRIQKIEKSGVVMHVFMYWACRCVCNPNTEQAEAGGDRQIP